MYPQNLISIYHQCKEDTDALATWLASTAFDHGYPEEDMINSTLDPEPDPYDDDYYDDGEIIRKRVKISAFVPLATFLAQLDQEVCFPPALRFALDRVIATRSCFLAQLAKHETRPSVASDVKSDELVDILRKVRRILRKMVDANDGTGVWNEGSEEDDITDIVSALKLYEPSEKLTTPPVTGPANQADTAPEAEANRDIDTLRSSIFWVWTEVKEGRMDVASAAVATDAATHLAEEIGLDAITLLSEHGREDGPLRSHLKVTTDCFDVIRENRQAADPDPIRPDIFGFAANFMDMLAESENDGFEIPLHDTSPLEGVDPKADRSAMTMDEQVKEDLALLTTYVTEQVTVLRLMKDDLDVHDGFLRAVGYLLGDPDPSYAMIFVITAQVFLDVFHIRRPDVRHARDQAARRQRPLATACEAYVTTSQGLDIGPAPRPINRDIMNFAAQASRHFSDRTKHVRRSHAMENGGDGKHAEPEEKNLFLTLSPVMSGVHMFYYRELFRNRGTKVAEQWGSIVHIAHLFNALKQEGLLKHQCEDLESLLAAVSEDSVFVSKPPAQRTEYFENLATQVGMPPEVLSTLNRGSHPSTFKRLRKHIRTMRCTSPVTDMFLPAYLQDRGEIDWTPESLDNVFFRNPSPADQSSETPGSEIPSRLKAVDGGQLPADEFIKRLALALDAEYPAASFPMLYMHLQCTKLILVACEKCLDELVKTHGEYLNSPVHAPTIIKCILLDYSGINGEPGQDRLLHMAADGVNALLAAGEGPLVTRYWQVIMHPEPNEDPEGWPKEDVEDSLDQVGSGVARVSRRRCP